MTDVRGTARGAPRAEPRKLGAPPGSVNFRRGGAALALPIAVALLLAAGCYPNPAPAPERPPRLDWPTVQGDVRRAAFAALPVPLDSPGVVWDIGAGRGLLAAPLATPPMIVTGTSNRIVMAFSTETGHPYWERHIDGAVGTGVVAGDGRIFAATGERSGKVYALEPLHGRIAWQRKLGFAAATPLLLGDTLVVPLLDRRVVALETRRGHPLWTARLPAQPAATPVPADSVLAVVASNDSIYTLRRADGALLGRAELGGFGSATPALTGDTLLVPLESGGLAALRLPGLTPLFRSGPRDTATELGYADPPQAVLAAPVVAPDGSIYFLDAAANVWHIAPGRDRATRLARLGGAARASLTLTRAGLLVGRLDGTLLLLRFDGSIAWTRTLDGSIAAPAAIAEGAIYVPLERGRIVKLR